MPQLKDFGSDGNRLALAQEQALGGKQPEATKFVIFVIMEGDSR